jgi:hypothetical protein
VQCSRRKKRAFKKGKTCSDTAPTVQNGRGSSPENGDKNDTVVESQVEMQEKAGKREASVA